jgi:hypothetical protein
MAMTALVDGKQRYSTVHSSVTANAIIMLVAAKEEQENKKHLNLQILQLKQTDRRRYLYCRIVCCKFYKKLKNHAMFNRSW